MIFPKTYKEIQNLFNKIPEDIHLEYKSGQAIDFSKVSEMSKDVSAFANSDGGVLIYGVQEDKSTHLPVSIDGVDSKKYSHEWLENIIKSNITPIIPDYEIKSIKIKGKPNLVIYSILIPKSYRTPHQAKDKKYYKRYNFKSEAMENYEIDDIRNRKQIAPSLINIRVEIESASIFLEVENIGNQVANDVKFTFPKELEKWVEKEEARIFRDGIKFFSPNQKYKFWYGVSFSVMHENSEIPSQFEIIASYQHPLYSERITESFGIDLLSFYGSYIGDSESTQQAKTIEKAIKELTKQVEKLNTHISEITNIAGASGLSLSFPTLKNIRNILGNKEFEKLNPVYQSYSFFMEILGVDINVAYRIRDYFRRSDISEGLQDIEGINAEIIEKIKQIFILDLDENEPVQPN
jgi:Putative DNA-binding domain